MTLQLFILLFTGGMICSYFLWFVLVPRHMQSLFRYRLWEVRDNLHDAMRRGDVPDCDVVRIEIQCIEKTIESASSITSLRIWTFVFFQSFCSKSPLVEEDHNVLERKRQKLKSTEIELLNKINAEVNSLCVFQSLFGSPSGWLLLSVMLPIGIVFALVSSVFKGLKNLAHRTLPRFSDTLAAFRNVRARVDADLTPPMDNYRKFAIGFGKRSYLDSRISSATMACPANF